MLLVINAEEIKLSHVVILSYSSHPLAFHHLCLTSHHKVAD